MKYLSKVLNKKWLTHDVIHLTIEKPNSFRYKLGQAVEIFIVKDDKTLNAPFTITSIYRKDDNIQFIIKVYPLHKGITVALSSLRANDSVFITKAWDSFNYNGNGVFIAAGSGITPFIPLLRCLKQQNKIKGHSLIYANKTRQDIILKDELKQLLDVNFYNILSRDHLSEHSYGRLDYDYLSESIRKIDQNFYLCGPIEFLKSVKRDLIKLGVNINLIQTIY